MTARIFVTEQNVDQRVPSFLTREVSIYDGRDIGMIVERSEIGWTWFRTMISGYPIECQNEERHVTWCIDYDNCIVESIRDVIDEIRSSVCELSSRECERDMRET